MLVYFGLEPDLLFSVENKDVIDDALFAIALSTAKHNKVLTKLSRAVTVPCRGKRTFNLAQINRIRYL